MKNNKAPKSKRPTQKKISDKEDLKDKQNNQGGIPDVDFKKLLGCG